MLKAPLFCPTTVLDHTFYYHGLRWLTCRMLLYFSAHVAFLTGGIEDLVDCMQEKSYFLSVDV